MPGSHSRASHSKNADEPPQNNDGCTAQLKKRKRVNKKSMTASTSELTPKGDISDEDIEMADGDTGLTQAYIPGRSRPLLEDEQLIMDKSAYRLFHEFQTESASLSFDILLDNLGYDRNVEVNGSAHSFTIVAGTQAPKGTHNNLVILRLSNLLPFCRKVKDSTTNAEGSSSPLDKDDDSSSDEENLDSQPELEAAVVNHKGVVNRVRAQQFGGRYLAGTWSDTKQVFIWDLTRPLTAVNDSAVMGEYARNNESPVPIFTFKGHKDEGYALDWHPYPSSAGHLLTGDCSGAIYHWLPRGSEDKRVNLFAHVKQSLQPSLTSLFLIFISLDRTCDQASGWTVGPSSFLGHSDSVEDLQWSPTEPTVFISVSADKSFRVWDLRSRSTSGSMITVTDAHPADINVASWNRLQSSCFLTGGDDGSLRIWDLRMVHKRYGGGGAGCNESSQLPAYTHLYNYHQKPITSVQWHPTDAGVFVATSEDDQVTLWDTTLEQAGDGPSDGVAQDDGDSHTSEKEEDVDVNSLPVQLLFIHSGQTEVKEAHWHPQIPGLLVSTALSGFNMFRTCNV